MNKQSTSESSTEEPLKVEKFRTFWTIIAWLVFAWSYNLYQKTGWDPVPVIEAAWHTIQIQARWEQKWSLTIVTERTAGDAEKILCINGMWNFPDNVSKVSVHPTNDGAYDIISKARYLQPGDNIQTVLTNKQDYAIIKDAQWNEIAKWYVSGNILELKKLSVMGVLVASQECTNE